MMLKAVLIPTQKYLEEKCVSFRGPQSNERGRNVIHVLFVLE